MKYREIIEAVEIVNKLGYRDIYQKSRKSKITLPRQVAMYLIRKETDLSLSSIGWLFNRDHSTVHSACKLIEGFIETGDSIVSTMISRIYTHMNPHDKVYLVRLSNSQILEIIKNSDDCDLIKELKLVINVEN